MAVTSNPAAPNEERKVQEIFGKVGAFFNFKRLSRQKNNLHISSPTSFIPAAIQLPQKAVIYPRLPPPPSPPSATTEVAKQSKRLSFFSRARTVSAPLAPTRVHTPVQANKRFSAASSFSVPAEKRLSCGWAPPHSTMASNEITSAKNLVARTKCPQQPASVHVPGALGIRRSWVERPLSVPTHLALGRVASNSTSLAATAGSQHSAHLQAIRRYPPLRMREPVIRYSVPASFRPTSQLRPVSQARERPPTFFRHSASFGTVPHGAPPPVWANAGSMRSLGQTRGRGRSVAGVQGGLVVQQELEQSRSEHGHAVEGKKGNSVVVAKKGETTEKEAQEQGEPEQKASSQTETVKSDSILSTTASLAVASRTATMTSSVKASVEMGAEMSSAPVWRALSSSHLSWKTAEEEMEEEEPKQEEEEEEEPEVRGEDNTLEGKIVEEEEKVEEKDDDDIPLSELAWKLKRKAREVREEQERECAAYVGKEKDKAI